MKTLEGYPTFVPYPPPAELPLDPTLIAELSAADRALGQLSGVGVILPNPHLLIGPFSRREAVSSSRIEGTEASLSDLFFFEAAPSMKPRVGDVREVHNYVTALEYGLSRHRELPISLRLLREMHERLMEGVRGENKTPGEFRRTQNWIGSPGCSLEEATFVPPPTAEMHEALHLFENYLHARTVLPPLVRLAVIHYQFEVIHPFLDGNGRIGRLLIALLLCVENLLPQPLLYLSSYFEHHRTEYYDHLLQVSQLRRWNEWIRFFLRGVAEQATDAVTRAHRVLELQQQFHERCHSVRSSALLLKLVDSLFVCPVTTTSFVRRHLEITPTAAKNNIDKLIARGILREVTGRKRNRIYVAEQILRTIEDPQVTS